uniref:GIY-YIG domain-containing protein n=2 Tax=Salix viminalis TaxID=40686 RepID=A0A6N2MP37_SALVM
MAGCARLKREDCKRTKHDSNFSKWQLLIGPSDWQDYFLGKEGASRYRVHNLPTTSGPGLYELGIVVSRSTLPRRDVGKLVPDGMVVVYLGQADNVKTRLQQYGRSGAHLGNTYSTGYVNDSKGDSLKTGLGLFEEIFSRGHSIVYRWASMKVKRDAEETEGQLLATFDYAWNKGCNGTRRPITNKKVLKSKPSKPVSPEKCAGFGDEDSKKIFSGIFKFSRSQPRLVSDRHGFNEDIVCICGFIMVDGITCKRPPVVGRKRCEEHKGRRVYGASYKSITQGNLDYPHGANLLSTTHNDQEHETTCGVNLGTRAVALRKRCEDHKGMQVNTSVSEPAAEDKIRMPVLRGVSSSFSDSINNNASSKHNAYSTSQCGSSNNPVKEHFPNTCGVMLGNGSFCRRQPIQGNKRCWQHKGMRADCNLFGVDSSLPRFDAPICAATLNNGSVCLRAPVTGEEEIPVAVFDDAI